MGPKMAILAARNGDHRDQNMALKWAIGRKIRNKKNSGGDPRLSPPLAPPPHSYKTRTRRTGSNQQMINISHSFAHLWHHFPPALCP